MRFIDLFAGLGGFHLALQKLGHECVFASEIDAELLELYRRNFPDSRRVAHGDIRLSKQNVPAHDILCAGFPCQPFSKSGMQAGVRDVTRGTLFHEILAILRRHRPEYVILENVGNFERHDLGSTWLTVRTSLEKLGYHVRGTEHVASGGHGLISPHHFGFPHTRERFFIVAARSPLPDEPFPKRAAILPALRSIAQSGKDLSSSDRLETKLTNPQVACINHWDAFLRAIPSEMPLPSFPVWGDELDASYPFEDRTPSSLTLAALKRCLPAAARNVRSHIEALEWLPSYARDWSSSFPPWKQAFIRQNREFFRLARPFLTREWIATLRSMPPSFRKFEWNCQGEERRLWKYVLQFRPSGLRAKRYTTIPALVSMTTTQIPILGPKRRFISRIEGLRLQGFPDDHLIPASRPAAFSALGNAVHVGVVTLVASELLKGGNVAALRDSRRRALFVEPIKITTRIPETARRGHA